jgi:hypothetical protein
VQRTPRTRRALVTGAVLFAALYGAPLLACNRDKLALTCDAARIKPASYALVTRGAALASAEQYDFWEQFAVDSPGRPIATTNEALAFAAQRAVELDVTNQMAHAIRARELLILGQVEMAEAAWHRVIESQGAVAWPATLGGKDELLVEFNGQDMRLYSRGQLQKRLSASSDDAVWAAAGGCIDSRIQAAAIVAWLNVSEIKNEKKGGLSFRLREPIAVTIGGRSRKLDRLELRLTGLAGDDRGRAAVARTCAPDTVRRMLTKLVDPERRIALPVAN